MRIVTARPHPPPAGGRAPVEHRQASFLLALVPVLFLVAVLGVNVLVYHGSPHIPLLLSAGVAALIGWRLGHTWRQLERGIVHGISMAVQACLILLVVGMLIGTWIVSGIVPAMIFYGLQIVSPSYFLVASCLICSIISLATGSSWSTAGTVGIALIGIGQGLGFPLPLVAGAIVSGSYLGDKMSPLSDTTNLAPAIAGTDIFKHISHMMFTTLPSFLIALTIYTVIGIFYKSNLLQMNTIEQILQVLQTQFTIHPVLLSPPLLVIVMVIFRLPALPALLGGAIIGGLFAMLVQGTGLGAVIEAAHGGYVSRSGLEALDSLLSRGGLNSMMSTVALVMCALSFGGIMEATGMLAVLARAILRLATTTGRLVVCTISTCVGMNVIAPDQYLSIVVPGRMYRDAFRKQGLDLKNLSRCLEDAGTLSSPLVPWNTCGAYMYATLGVSPLAYLPFAFVNLLNPCISILYGFTGWTMHPAEEEAADEAALVTGITVAAEDGDETPTRADAAAGGGSAGSISSGTRAEGNT